MSSQTLELKWAHHKSNMTLELQELYLSDALLDVTIACGEFNLKAHKTVLSASSTFFRKLFMDNPCKHPILIMTDIEFEDLKTIVEFMYQGEVRISREKLTQFLKTADKLKIKGLTNIDNMNLNNSSEQPAIVTDSCYSSGPWERTNTQSELQDANDKETVDSSPREVMDYVRTDVNLEAPAVKVEEDISHSVDNSCIYWQNECFDQTSSSSVLPDSNLPNLSIVSCELSIPSASRRLSTPPINPSVVLHEKLPLSSVSHKLSAPPIPHKLSAISATDQLSSSSAPHQITSTPSTSISHQFEVPLNSERCAYPESQTDNEELTQGPDENTGDDINPVNLYQSHEQSSIIIPSSTKSSESFESLGSQSSQGIKTDNEILIGANVIHSIVQEGTSDICKVLNFRKYVPSFFTCRYCKKSFLKYDMLEKHLQLHSKLRKFICEVCNNRFSRQHHLKTHLRIHTGEKPFACKYCSQRFTQLRTLQYHERTHTGEKPFECCYCSNRFRDRSALKMHERKHTGQ